MARATKEESEQTAKRILEIATRHFHTLGFGGTDLVSVAKEAGVTRGAIYHHYPNKQALFEAVVADIHARLQNQIENAASTTDDLWQQLERGCEAFIDAAIDPSVRQILLIEAPAILGWETWRALDQQTSFASLTDVLHQLAEAGVIGDIPIEATARLLSGAMNEAALWIASSPDPTQARTQALSSLTILLRSLKSS